MVRIPSEGFEPSFRVSKTLRLSVTARGHSDKGRIRTYNVYHMGSWFTASRLHRSDHLAMYYYYYYYFTLRRFFGGLPAVRLRLRTLKP